MNSPAVEQSGAYQELRPLVHKSSRFMTHDRMQRLRTQHLAHSCCENEDMDTALPSHAVVLAWSQPITQCPETAVNRDACWASLFWTSHASMPILPVRACRDQRLSSSIEYKRSMPPCTHEDRMKTTICCRSCHTNTSTTGKVPCQPQRATCP